MLSYVMGKFNKFLMKDKHLVNKNFFLKRFDKILLLHLLNVQ